MSQIAPHPARDAEFLSRLHDGELNAAERAQFESHRAHCAECRNAAFDFEAALSLYRASRPKPAAPDLSARILRKLQQSNRRRPAFGASFDIDLRWAGAFAAAVIAAIIGFSIVARQEADKKMARIEPIPVTMQENAREDKNESPKPSAEEPAKPASRADHARRQSALDKGLLAKDAEEGGAAPKTAALQPPAAPAAPANAAPAPPTERKEAAARDKSSAGSSGSYVIDGVNMTDTARSTVQKSAESSGGEGRAGYFDYDATDVRVTITAADGGSSPELLADQKIDLPPSERGREYSLSIDPQGRVSEVRLVEKVRQKAARVPSSADEKQQLAAAQAVKPPQALWDLRFHPADRPRLVLVTVK